MGRVPGADTSGRIYINAQGTRMRLTLSDGSERIVEPWSLLRLTDGLTVVRAEPAQRQAA